ncbi:MAG: molybdopterin-dependent oxidoreductase [Treponema sp.]|nr:molybdopterin-dependent oxidoreductase [Treponema sp.]
MQKGARSEFECKSHVSEEGKLISLQMNITLDIGSANPYAKNIIDRLVIASLGTYTIPNVFIEAKAVSSNRIPTSINPEMIDSQVFFALENHITHIAEEIKLLPTEFRQKNILPLSKNSIMPFLFKSEYILETIFNTISVSDFNRKHASFMLNAKDHLSRENTFFALPIRGIGFACAFDGSGFLDDESFLKQNKISLTLESEESATINAATPSPTVLNVWKKIINSTLGITDSNIHLKPFENESEYETSFYSNIGITTQLLSKICLDITKKRPIKKFPLTVKKSIASSAKKTWDKTNFRGGPFYSTSFASAALEVELAPHTYEVNIKSVWITIECGKILVPKAAENAIRTALQQEFQNLIVGEILDCDDVHISFIKSEREPVQIGSLIHSIIPTAFSSALSQALGIRVHSLPCDTEILYTLGEKHENSTTSK